MSAPSDYEVFDVTPKTIEEVLAEIGPIPFDDKKPAPVVEEAAFDRNVVRTRVEPEAEVVEEPVEVTEVAFDRNVVRRPVE